jgi:hypothetical protein
VEVQLSLEASTLVFDVWPGLRELACVHNCGIIPRDPRRHERTGRAHRP